MMAVAEEPVTSTNECVSARMTAEKLVGRYSRTLACVWEEHAIRSETGFSTREKMAGYSLTECMTAEKLVGRYSRTLACIYEKGAIISD